MVVSELINNAARHVVQDGIGSIPVQLDHTLARDNAEYTGSPGLAAGYVATSPGDRTYVTRHQVNLMPTVGSIVDVAR